MYYFWVWYLFFTEQTLHGRDAAGFSNPGGLAVMWWAKFAPLVVIGLTELQKAHPAHPLAAALTT